MSSSEAARYKAFADQGDPLGQINYGVCLENGTGIAKDLSEAVE
jgi:TPR repeat protein